MTEYYILKLSAKYYADYPATKFPEIEHKKDRPYIVLVMQIMDRTFAIPFRTHLRHKYCYKFVDSDRETDSNTGIDFTKAVVLNKFDYLGEFVRINDKEFLELNKRFYFIQEQFYNYVLGYIRFAEGNGTEYDVQKYKYSTLKYFHKELNIVEQNKSSNKEKSYCKENYKVKDEDEREL